MSESKPSYSPASGDALIEEVRGLRREICREFGNDVDRLSDHLLKVEQDYTARRGAYAGVSSAAAAAVIKSWGTDPWRTDDPLIDEVRDIRRQLADDNR